MEWLLPHITRINNFCNTLEHGQKSYLHISRNLPRGERNIEVEERVFSRPPKLTRMNDMPSGEAQVERLDDEEPDFEKRKESNSDENEAEYPANNDIDYKGQERRYNEIMEAKSNRLPVSVIVSDRSNSMGSAPSPTSSMNDSSDWYLHHGDDKAGKGKGRGKSYMYKPAPMVKKSERRFISADKKDSTYWERRKRNNAAARKSRESRREKEIEVNRKCDLLKQENDGMRFTIINLQERNVQLESTLKLYKEILIKNNLL